MYDIKIIMLTIIVHIFIYLPHCRLEDNKRNHKQCLTCYALYFHNFLSVFLTNFIY